MKKPQILFLLSIVCLFVSCEKNNDIDKLSYKNDKEQVTICTWDESKVADEAAWEKYIAEPIVEEESCGCIVSGVVKYVSKKSQTVLLVYYGKGECDKLAYLVSCEDGDCKGKETKKCQFELDCEPAG